MPAMMVSGRDALEMVATKTGEWNWALVGPNAEQLPLVGGGSGGLDELRLCLAKQEAESARENQGSNFFGLIRMKFGGGRVARTKHVFIHAARVDGENTVSAVKHGKAMAVKGAMEKAMLEFVHFSTKIEATALEDLGLETILDKLQKASQADADLLSLDAYYEAQEAHRKEVGVKARARTAEEAAKAGDEQALNEAVVEEVFNEQMAPSAEAAAGEMSDDDLAEDEVETMGATQTREVTVEEEQEKEVKRERRKSLRAEAAATAPTPIFDKIETVPAAASAIAFSAAQVEAPAAGLAIAAAMGVARAAPAQVQEHLTQYKVADLVFVYSGANKTWLDDGVVVEVLKEAVSRDGLVLSPQTVKVQYNNRRQFKWVTLVQQAHFVKPSFRPQPPPALIGELMKETHNFISQWHVRYFELSKGYLQWWMSCDDAKKGQPPNGSLSLVGMEMDVRGTVMHLRTNNSKGIIYSFDATQMDALTKWSSGLRSHQQYCIKMQAYMLQQASEAGKGDSTAQEKVSDMVQERKKRASLSAGMQPTTTSQY